MSFPELVATATRVLRRDDGDDNDGPSNCVTATPGPHGHVSQLDACNAYYNYDPSFGAAAAVAVIFGLLLGVHIVQGIAFKKVSVTVLGLPACGH